MTAPLTASPAPTAAAVSTRGIRSSQTMPSRSSLSGVVPSPRWCRTDAQTSPAVMSAGPKVTARITDATSAAPKAPATITVEGFAVREFLAGRSLLAGRGNLAGRACRDQPSLSRPPLLIQPQPTQLPTQLHDRRNRPHPGLAGRERDHEVALVDDSVEARGGGVRLQHADLLLRRVRHGVDQHDDVGIRCDDRLPAVRRPGLAELFCDIGEPEVVENHLRRAGAAADER